VPPVIGLRQGFLFTEWVGSIEQPAERPSVQEILASLPFYIAARAKRLRLNKDPCFTITGYRWTGWDTLLHSLCRPYGRRLGRLKAKALKAALERYVTPMPSLIDGRMARAAWVKDERGIFKSDFEHHNFGGGQPDLVDPAFDLASAVHELDLSEEDERQLLDTYILVSGDRHVRDRLLLNKLLAGILAVQTAAYWAARAGPRDMQEECNHRVNAARDFLVFQMNRHAARRLEHAMPSRWSKRLFFLDLDGVFDTEAFGVSFQHTTPSGLEALRLLKAHGYSVVLNTGRSIEHVRNYCRSYGLPGGIAEYGSVFVDAVRQIELPLVDEAARKQLSRCRDLLRRLPGVFIDVGYQWAVRAYRYDGRGTVGLTVAELDDLLIRSGLHKLRFIARDVDCYILAHDVNKGTALRAVERYLAKVEGPIVAMGDSRQDHDMLEQADIAYMPANSTREDRKLGRRRGYRLMREPRQRGLLAAVRDLTGDHSTGLDAPAPQAAPVGSAWLIDAVLRAADRPRHRQLLALLDRRHV
jgi:hydroxymethylpyrimidine pyrophosphatase-like HAD family hydrolase